VAGAPVPVPASDFSYYDAETSVEIATSLLPAPDKNKQLFALEVDGDSMIDAMVNDGDFVIMKPVANNAEVRNGEMVAVWLPNRDETTLKYFYKEKEGYRLQPANPPMQPIMINKEEPLEIKGKVVMVIRKVDTVAV
jgi:repressor LexA